MLKGQFPKRITLYENGFPLDKGLKESLYVRKAENAE
jgi:hypothetical protein